MASIPELLHLRQDFTFEQKHLIGDKGEYLKKPTSTLVYTYLVNIE